MTGQAAALSVPHPEIAGGLMLMSAFRYVAPVLGAAALVTAMMVAEAGPASAAGSPTVSNCADAGTGSLRQALADAPSGDVITFALAPACSVITLTTGPLAIAENVKIDGPGAGQLAVSGGNNSGVFTVAPTATTAQITGLSIENGYAVDGAGIFNQGGLTVSASILTHNVSELGGAIYNTGSLTVIGSSVSSNAAELDDSHAAPAGGIYNSPVGTLQLGNTILDHNWAIKGGGLDNEGTATVTDSTITGNRATSIVDGAIGGGILSTGQLTVTRSSVTANQVYTEVTGGAGGGLSLSGTSDIEDSTVAGNSSTSWGGGINLTAGTLAVKNSTIAGNTAGTGAALYASGGSGSLRHVTMAYSPNAPQSELFTSVPLSVVATIIAAGGSGHAACAGNGLVDKGFNLADDLSCPLLAANHSLPNTKPLLDAAGLRDNGGTTLTVGLQFSSRARGAVTPASDCAAADQRGFVRPTPCDIGAIEAGPYRSSTTVLTSATNPSVYGTAAALTAVVSTTDGVGRVTFTADGAKIAGCSGLVLSLGGSTSTYSATCLANLPAGAHQVVAVYSGSAAFASSTGSLSQVVAPMPNTVTLGSSANPAAYGQSITFTAKVGSSDGRGSVTFQDNGAPMPGCASYLPLAGSQTVKCTTAKLTRGSHTVTAVYTGHGNYAGATGRLVQQVS